MIQCWMWFWLVHVHLRIMLSMLYVETHRNIGDSPTNNDYHNDPWSFLWEQPHYTYYQNRSEEIPLQYYLLLFAVVYLIWNLIVVHLFFVLFYNLGFKGILCIISGYAYTPCRRSCLPCTLVVLTMEVPQVWMQKLQLQRSEGWEI